jgi:hypothetical protein
MAGIMKAQKEIIGANFRKVFYNYKIASLDNVGWAEVKNRIR